jgi:site-specific recombinase XerC
MVDDLYQTYGNVPAVRVKSGKGAKARMVPFGDMLWARQIVEIWLNEREMGSVFTAMRRRSRRHGRPADDAQADDHAQCPTDVEAIPDLN